MVALSNTEFILILWVSQVGSMVKSTCQARDTNFILGLEDPLEKEMATPLQYSCLENHMYRAYKQATLYGYKRVRYDLATKQQQLIFEQCDAWDPLEIRGQCVSRPYS